MEHEEAVENMVAERYVLGELHDEERERFEEHFFSCPECAQDVRDLATITAGAKELLSRPRKTEPPKQRAAAPSAWRWPWLQLSPSFALSGALALVTLFAVTTSYQAAQLRGLVRPQVLASFLLRPETRGEAAAIPMQRIGAFLLLEADLPLSTGELQWELRQTGSEKVIDRQTAPSPDHGASFKVLLPASIVPAGEYTLTVRSLSRPSENPRIFKFKISPNGS